jgi:MFS family permease
VLFGLSSAVDMLLFYPAGRVMDLYGRVWVAVPCLLLLALGLLAVPCLLLLALGLLAVPFTSGAVSLGLASALMGIGNGMGSGVGMVLGADASPREGRAAFLGVWRLCPDVGTSVGPLVLGAVTATAGLASGSLVVVGWAWRAPRPCTAGYPARTRPPAPAIRANGMTIRSLLLRCPMPQRIRATGSQHRAAGAGRPRDRARG